MMLRFLTYNSPISPIIIFGKVRTEFITFCISKLNTAHTAPGIAAETPVRAGVVRKAGVVAESPPGRPNYFRSGYSPEN